MRRGARLCGPRLFERRDLRAITVYFSGEAGAGQESYCVRFEWAEENRGKPARLRRNALATLDTQGFSSDVARLAGQLCYISD